MLRNTATMNTLSLKSQVKVLLPLPLVGPYDYRVPENLSVHNGDYVTVPLGNRLEKGVVWGKGEYEGPEEKLKYINDVLDIPPMEYEMRQFIDWTAEYTLSRPGLVLRMAMSASVEFDKMKQQKAIILSPGAGNKRIRMTRARASVLQIVSDGKPHSINDLASHAGVSVGVIRGLIEVGLLESISVMVEKTLDLPSWKMPRPSLSDQQTAAAELLAASVRKASTSIDSGFVVFALDGVTGSGKTETYFEAVSASLEEGRQTLVLLPEIALTAQWLDRFKKRFGALPVQWHSNLSAAERRSSWHAAASGVTKVIVGARSALYLPFPNLGLIVVDEEHDVAFKQEDGVIYNARDMAVVRGHIGRFPVVLASATPSLETITNIETGRYKRLSLPQRHGGATLPTVDIVDMRTESSEQHSWLSPILIEAIQKTLVAKNQIMLFLNRRGYAPLTLCRQCGFRIYCPNCTAWLVEHRARARMQCHHCGFSMPVPQECPECTACNSLVACGPGTERLAEEVREKFSAARLAVMTSDTVHSPSEATKLVESIKRRDVDILIGTQIVAKGYNFPHLTLVGVIDADLGLSGGDLRAAERVYQTLHQVGGRAGRAEKSGHVILQTYQPENPIMQALVSGDRDYFLELESQTRRKYSMPPFGRLVALIVSGLEKRLVDAAAHELGRTCPIAEGIAVFGPAEAPLSILRGRHRRRLLLKANQTIRVQKIVRQWLSATKIPRGVRVKVDVDPYSFM